jgi:hypothetical protein
MLIVIEKLVERELVKKQQANFIVAWSSSTIRKAGDRFHYNFKAGMQADLFAYGGVNFGSTTSTQKQAQ